MAYTTIDDPSAYFQTVLYVGNSGSQSITNDGNSDLQPDLLWIKNRGANQAHVLQDSTRGPTKALYSHANAGEDNYSEGNGVNAFNSDGFGLNASNDLYNNSGSNYASFQWNANNGTTTTNSAGSNGADHESVYQANDTAGFSIVTYTSDSASGDTIIKHGLSTAPTFMIHKSRSATGSWWVYHKDLTNDGYVVLDTDGANQDGSTNVWRNTAPTSSVFKLGLNSIASSNETMVAYCFAPIQGYSKFGSYTGNGNVDGPFVYTGFKPAWILTKGLGSSRYWVLRDSTRDPFNPAIHDFYPHLSQAEYTTGMTIDHLSNGFKFRGTDPTFNGNGENYIYMAFAEHPFVSSEGVPATAR